MVVSVRFADGFPSARSIEPQGDLPQTLPLSCALRLVKRGRTAPGS